MTSCELCLHDEKVKFHYATMDLYREHMQLVHHITLDEDDRSIKDRPRDIPEKPESRVVQIPPRR